MTETSSGKPGKPQEHKSPLSSHCAPGNTNTNARNTFPSLPSWHPSNHLPPCERLQTSKGPPFTRDHSGVTKTQVKMPLLQNTSSFRLNCFKNRASSLKKQQNTAEQQSHTQQQRAATSKQKKLKQTNKQKTKQKPPSTNKKRKKNQNQIKQTIPGKQEEVMLEFPPAALHVQSPALPSLEQCSHATYTSSPQVFTQKRLQTSCTKSWLFFCFFFLFARHPSCFLARQQLRSAQQLCEHQTPAVPGARAQVQPPFCETCSKSSEVTKVSLGDNGQH